MSEQPIRFADGGAYERMMGVWSRLAGNIFLDWLAPAAGQRWIDIGCGNGAFTELIVERGAPAEVQGIDPSEAQIEFARKRAPGSIAEYRLGGAESLPFPDGHFDAATMALVIFFVPDPQKGVAEMMRVVRPGGTVAAYAWDLPEGGFPLEPLLIELRAVGVNPPAPPSEAISRMPALVNLWKGAGLEKVASREIRVQRTFADFEEYWSVAQASSFGNAIAALPPDTVEQMKARTRARMPAGADGRVTYEAWANAVTGLVPQ